MIPKKTRRTVYAIITGKIATIYKGRRVVKSYYSGEKLLGIIETERNTCHG